MSTPTPINSLYYDEPRAAKIREPENLSTIHSVIHSGVSIMVDNQLEANAIIAAWRVIMQAAAEKADEVLVAMRREASA